MRYISQSSDTDEDYPMKFHILLVFKQDEETLRKFLTSEISITFSEKAESLKTLLEKLSGFVRLESVQSITISQASV